MRGHCLAAHFLTSRPFQKKPGEELNLRPRSQIPGYWAAIRPGCVSTPYRNRTCIFHVESVAVWPFLRRERIVLWEQKDLNLHSLAASDLQSERVPVLITPQKVAQAGLEPAGRAYQARMFTSYITTHFKKTAEQSRRAYRTAVRPLGRNRTNNILMMNQVLYQ